MRCVKIFWMVRQGHKRAFNRVRYARIIEKKWIDAETGSKTMREIFLIAVG